ncbi:MAG: hypothetical protein KDB82_05970 [Planctomycetes bacterium]|nr:hypothetical protein [Planctomycetota bacterium]
MTQAEATREIRELLSGRPGGVNRLLKRFGKPLLDYCTALVPDRSEPFERMLEDILVDVISQSRAAARARSDEEVFEFVVESALRTVRARYREILEGEAKPTKATSSYNFKEILARTSMTEAELTEGISSGRIRAVRENDQMKVKPDGIPGLAPRKAHYAFHVPAAERELLCLHFRLGFSPETIARWAGSTPAQIEEMLGTAANNLAKGMAKKGEGPDRQDTEIRRYIDGRMDGDATAKFERSIIKDKIAQRRLDELRSQSDGIRELFDSDHYDLSSVSVNVRARNPHHSLALPPVAALWLQVVGIAGILLMFHSVGAYIAPPDVKVSALEGKVGLPPEGWLPVGGDVETHSGAQALLVLDDSNRIVMAPQSKLELLEPREDARQVLGLSEGEIWGRFTSAGHPFRIEFPVRGDTYGEIASDAGAEFDLISGPQTLGMLPDSLERERIRAFAAAFEPDGDSLAASRALKTFANFRFGLDSEDDPGLKVGDRIESIEGLAIRNREDLSAAVRTLKAGESLQVTVRRGDERVAMPLTSLDEKPGAVVRVFHGALMAGPRGGQSVLVNRGQWALFTPGQPPLVGLRGIEEFRLLRIDANERFKDRLHWLNAESYPLRAENNLLVVERALRELAEKLEGIRADEIQRDGPREISTFENIIREAISDAQDRIAQGKARESGPGVESLSDEALVASEDQILGVIEHWRRQSATGVYPTLGDAAKTLKSRILKDSDELETRGEEITRSLLMQDEIKKKNEAIGRQDASIEELKKSEFYDPDNAKRAAIDAQIAELQEKVRAGSDAAGRKELLMVKLNALDEKIDTQRRKISGLEKAVASAKAALADVNAMLDANIYTAEKLKAAEESKTAAETALTTAKAELQTMEQQVTDAQKALTEAEKQVTEAKKPIADLTKARDTAQDALTDAITKRSAAQTKADDADKEVERLQGELDALEENDPAREARQKELDTAKTAAQTAQDELTDAKEAAADANDALDAANEDLKSAEETVADREAKRDRAELNVEGAKVRRDGGKDDVKDAEKALKDAEKILKDQRDAKAARAILDTHKTESEAALDEAQSSLKTVQDKISELDKQAQPQRDKLNEELALIKAGEEAKQGIEDQKAERGRYQAISDDIERHATDRQVLVDERDQLANSNLVKNYATLQAEYEALSRRIDAFKFVSARGIIEDKNFALEQKAAQDRFREAAEAATEQAVKLLDKWCPPYDDDAYEPFKGKEGAELRASVLKALWQLYYDTGLNGGSDGNEIICYYVAIQSGAGAEALARLDDRWQAYLTEAVGRTGFEALAAMSPKALQQPAPEKAAEGGAEKDE